MQAGIVQKIFHDHFKGYNKKHSVSRRERKAAWNILTCRTRQQGHHVDECPNGHPGVWTFYVGMLFFLLTY